LRAPATATLDRVIKPGRIWILGGVRRTQRRPLQLGYDFNLDGLTTPLTGSIEDNLGLELPCKHQKKQI